MSFFRLLKQLKVSGLLLLLILLAWSPGVWALELHSFVLNDCRVFKGILLDVVESETEQDQILIIDLKGRLREFPREEINFLGLYNVLENPLPALHLTPELMALARTFWVQDKQVIGWPVKFIENLVFIYDMRGRTHVLDLFKINRIRPAPNQEVGSLSLPQPKPSYLSLSNVASQCKFGRASRKEREQIVHPTRVMGNKTQISDFVDGFRSGVQAVRSYQERTYLYAKPFLFPKETLMGVSFFNEDRLNPETPMPLYFQWSTGRPYRFQSLTKIGGFHLDDAPTMDPMTAILSEVKSHIFHASFIGNVRALPAGTEYFSEVYEDSELRETIDDGSDVRTATGFNYFAYMGGDYESWSFSLGLSYPSALILIKEEFREVLGSSMAPAFRLRYTTDSWQWRAVVSTLNRSASSGKVNDRQISISQNTTSVGYVDSFDFDLSYLKAGVSHSLTPALDLGVEQLYLKGEYKEVLASSDRNQIDYEHIITQLRVAHRFGEYVRLRGYYNIYFVKRDYTFMSESDEDNRNYSQWGGVFELIF